MRQLPAIPLLAISLILFVLSGEPVSGQKGWVEIPAPEPAVVAGVEEKLWLSRRPPESEFDVIRLHRYRATELPAASARVATVLYLPGTNMNGSLPRDAAALLDPNYNMWLWLAQRGVEIYALDYRTHAVPPDRDDSLDFMSHWTVEAFVEDARSALEWIEAEMSREGRDPDSEPIVVAGFSRGVSYAYALACVAEQIDGVVALDGSFKSVNSLAAGTSPNDESLASVRKKALSAGRYASDVAAGIGWEPRDQLMRSTMADPAGPPGDEQYPNIGSQLAELLYQAWRPGGLAHPIGASSGRGISRPEVLAALLRGYDRFFPAVQDVDGRRLPVVLDHPEVALDDCFGKSEDPVLWFGATGMGAPWLLDGMFSATRFGKTPKAELHVLEGYGHLDVLVSESARDDVFSPMLDWLRRR